jgi:glutamate racemase
MKNSIGIFDSGVGGLTVVKEMYRLLPSENILYFGDTKRVPYGSKSKEEILAIVREIIDWMLLSNIKAVAMACNTSSALALETVRTEYDIPIFGLIEPTAKYIQSCGGDIKKVGVIATEATVKSNNYSKLIKQYSQEKQVIEIPCPGLVEIIEAGQASSKKAYKEVKNFIDPLLAADVDKIVLGCTHYPFISDIIRDISGREDILINPAEYMISEMKDILESKQMANTFNPGPVRDFYVSASPLQFIKVGNKLLPGTLDSNNVMVDIPGKPLQALAVS